jgi:hypothetical protein
MSALPYPGYAWNSPGSVFNEPSLISGSSGGSAGNQYNAVAAPSQYDVACFQHFTNHA